MRHIIPVILAISMLFGAYNHIAAPEFYSAMIPPFILESFANILSAVVEFVIGVALLIPAYRKWGGLGFMGLMIAFMPIHVWDLFRENPAIGSSNAAIIRFLMQFLLIYLGWLVYKRNK